MTNLWMRAVAEVACPACGVPPLASCVIVKKDGEKITGIHTARRDAVRALDLDLDSAKGVAP